MKSACSLLALLMATRIFAEAAVPVIDREGQSYVSAARLERAGSIAIKRLPDQKQLIACSGERCALVNEFIDDPGDLLVRIDSLGKALGARPRFDQARGTVSFELLPDLTPPTGATPRVGQLAPDFRLTKLDGTPVALSDFAGKRVLINSWASW